MKTHSTNLYSYSSTNNIHVASVVADGSDGLLVDHGQLVRRVLDVLVEWQGVDGGVAVLDDGG